MLTAERLRELLNYDPETGVFTRRSAVPGHRIGEMVGCLDKDTGYLKIRIDYRLLSAHRLAWLYMTGAFPKNKIDHRDGDRLNNVFENLRSASDRINAQNVRRAQSNNQTGFLGVSRKRKKFSARIFFDGTQKLVGIFDSPEAAHDAYVAAKRIHHEGCTI